MSDSMRAEVVIEPDGHRAFSLEVRRGPSVNMLADKIHGGWLAAVPGDQQRIQLTTSAPTPPTATAVEAVVKSALVNLGFNDPWVKLAS